MFLTAPEARERSVVSVGFSQICSSLNKRPVIQNFKVQLTMRTTFQMSDEHYRMFAIVMQWLLK